MIKTKLLKSYRAYFQWTWLINQFFHGNPCLQGMEFRYIYFFFFNSSKRRVRSSKSMSSSSLLVTLPADGAKLSTGTEGRSGRSKSRGGLELNLVRGLGFGWVTFALSSVFRVLFGELSLEDGRLPVSKLSGGILKWSRFFPSGGAVDVICGWKLPPTG